MTITDGLILLMVALTWVAVLLDGSDIDRSAQLILYSLGGVELYNALLNDRDGRWGAFVLCCAATQAVVISIKKRRLQRREAATGGE